MPSRFLLSFVILLGLVSPSAGEANAPNADRGSSVDLHKLPSVRVRRVKGVRLRAKAVVQRRLHADDIKIVWTLDYKGPRNRVILLEPSLELETNGDTKVAFYARGKDGRTYGVHVESQHTPPSFTSIPSIHMPKREWFVTLKKGKRVSDSITVSARKVRDHFTEKYPRQFGARKPPALYFQLYHAPSYTGYGFGIKAWTGKLVTPVMKVRLKKW
jgi:hypothetical protein